ncbi:MAG: SMP-30/gluconolactonase/LRE family protein [Bacteroidota bacterium]
MRAIVRITILLILVIISYLLFWPIGFKPAAWQPAEAPAMSGAFAPNEILDQLELISIGTDHGPEDVDVDAQGRMYFGTEEGRVLRCNKDGSDLEVFVETGGRPLGLDFDAAGNLIIADAEKGLLRVSPKGKMETLTTEHGNLPFMFTDDIEVGADGKYYFSDASSKWDIHHFVYDLMECVAYGRLLVYDPVSKQTDLLLDSLFFANGVALNDSADFVLINETAQYRTRKYWLKGPKKGTHEIFAENLPGFPDGISRGSDGIFWMAIPTPRQESLDELMGKPFMKKVIMRLPEFVQPAAERYSFALGFDAEGQVVYNLQDPDGIFSQVTSVQERGNTLYFGSLVEPVFGRMPLSNLPQR